jgi:two-component system, NarL family, sensor kinase
VTKTRPAGPADVTGRHFRLASPVTATVLGVLVVALAAASVVLAAFIRQLTILSVGPAAPVIAIYAVVGVVVARRRPRNPIGWILLIFILLLVLSTDAGDYAVLYYRFGHHGLPFAAAAVVLLPLWVPAIMLFPLIILLFPDGGLTSRRWRWVLGVYAAAGALATAAVDSPAIAAVAAHDVHLDSFGDVTNKGHQAAAVGGAEVLGVAVIAVLWVSFVVHQVRNWRRAAGERRQQLKWLASSAAFTIVVVAVSFAIPSTSVSGQVLGVGLAALPIGIGVGILKYRLYDIDRIISRTLAYTIVTGLLVGVYAGLVLLATQVLEIKSPIAVAASTLAVAALFNPLRRRVSAWWTGGSTGPGTTPTRPWPRSRPASRMPSTLTWSGMTWPV